MESRLFKNKFEKLPADLKREALDYIEFLWQKCEKKTKKEGFNFAWEGGLADLKDKYTSVELQHKALKWR